MIQFLSRRHLVKVLVLTAAFLLTAAPGHAGDEAILDVVNREGHSRAFSLADLDALGTHQTVTTTPWHEGAITFEGPLLRDVLAAAGLRNRDVEIKGLNEYAVVVPASDIEKFPVILATRANGSPLKVREHGPLFVIYPFDQDPSLKSEIYYARSVWQVARISAK